MRGVMRNVRWAIVLLVSGVIIVWPQEDSVPSPPQSAPAFTRHARSIPADLAIPLCAPQSEDSLSTDGIANLLRDHGVKLPIPRYMPEPTFSHEAMRQKRLGRVPNFRVVVGGVVDAEGQPRKLCIERSAGYGLNAKAAEAVAQYRFVPAMLNDKPVPFRIGIRVDFRTY